MSFNFSNELVFNTFFITYVVLGAEGTPDSVNPSVLDEEEGLPSPPFDEAFFATQPTSMELSEVTVLFCLFTKKVT